MNGAVTLIRNRGTSARPRGLWFRPFVVVALGTSLSSCGVGNSSAATGPDAVGGTFKASVDGAAWVSNTSTARAVAGGTFTITGTQISSGTSISMAFYNLGKPGTYPLGVGPSVPGGTSTLIVGSGSWNTPLSGAAGTVTISAVSPTRLVGSFNYTATPVLVGPASKVVTQGQFDLAVTGPATLTVPDNAGSTFTGTLGSTSFNAATIVSVTSPSSGTLSIGASNTSYNLNIIMSGYTGVGSYALGAAAATTGQTRTIQVIQSGTTKFWGGSTATTSGTIQITSASATRIKGTIAGTVTSQTEGALAISATFDYGVP